MAELRVGPDRAGRWVTVEAGRITGVGEGGGPPETGGEELPCEGGWIEPGRVNAHTHLYSGLAPLGLPEPAPRPERFLEILERLWWRLDRALDAEMLGASARWYVAEALLAGTTALVDHHESPAFVDGSLDVLADACENLGVRAVLCYGATERNEGRSEARRGLAQHERLAARARGSTCIAAAVGLHASFTVSDETIREAADLARSLGTVLHVHLAEDAADVEDARARGHAGPLERFEALDALVEGSILAHGVCLDRAQVRRAEERGCWLVHNPRSNRANGVGWAGALVASARVALGTDGFPSDMVVERDALADEARRRWEPADVAPRRLAGGRHLLGERFGCSFELEPGAAADLIVTADGAVRHVVVGGRVVVRDGRLVTGDRDEMRAEAERQAARLAERMKNLGA